MYFTNSENGLAIRNELVYRTIGGQHPAFSWLHYDSYKFLPKKVDTTVDAGVYDDYVGHYAYAMLTVTREGDRVFAQLTGATKVRNLPHIGDGVLLEGGRCPGYLRQKRSRGSRQSHPSSAWQV